MFQLAFLFEQPAEVVLILAASNQTQSRSPLSLKQPLQLQASFENVNTLTDADAFGTIQNGFLIYTTWTQSIQPSFSYGLWHKDRHFHL